MGNSIWVSSLAQESNLTLFYISYPISKFCWFLLPKYSIFLNQVCLNITILVQNTITYFLDHRTSFVTGFFTSITPLLPSTQLSGWAVESPKVQMTIFVFSRKSCWWSPSLPQFVFALSGWSSLGYHWTGDVWETTGCISKYRFLLWSVEPPKEYSSSCWTGRILPRIQPKSDTHLKNFYFKINKFQDKILMWSETPRVWVEGHIS